MQQKIKKDGTIVDTITDLGTLVIVDDMEDDEMDTMKSKCSITWSMVPLPASLPVLFFTL